MSPPHEPPLLPVPVPPQPKRFSPPQGGEIITCGEKSYFVGTRIGQGGFGRVYECQDEWGNDLVAKVIVPVNRTYGQVRDAWGRELHNLLTLRHPNITFIHDAFECNDTFYLIIERCHSTLADLLAWPELEGNMWLPHLAKAVLQAIHFIHEADYVHKDLHPGNVFMLYQRDAMMPQKDPVLVFKVGDLGISNLESDIDVFNTLLARWMVPPEFLSPGQFGLVGRTVDIYHAGLMFLSLLLGHTPTFTDREILNGVPRQTAEALDSQFAPAIARALRRTVAQRTPTALAFWRDIVKALHGKA